MQDPACLHMAILYPAKMASKAAFDHSFLSECNCASIGQLLVMKSIPAVGDDIDSETPCKTSVSQSENNMTDEAQKTFDSKHVSSRSSETLRMMAVVALDRLRIDLVHGLVEH